MMDKAFFIFQLIFFGKYFIHKRTVNWNKAGINIRLKWFKDANIPFSKVASCTYHNETLEVIKTNAKRYQFDLSQVHPDDKEKLVEIFKRYTPNHKFKFV